MPNRKIYQDRRTLTRGQLAIELRLLADQLESGQDLSYGGLEAEGRIAVPDRVDRELNIEWSPRDAGFTMGVEIMWPICSSSSATAMPATHV
ncbi:hypothetical protein ACQPZ2_36670 [Nocardia pseudovaccinii]|uniref:hypothetical protein n=1 Tax=Nocardia pseudovaccinii TaxID=189540 RepID=UPI003D8C2C18